jgi:hypothetical protein
MQKMTRPDDLRGRNETGGSGRLVCRGLGGGTRAGGPLCIHQWR